MTPRPDVWAIGLTMVDDLYVEGEPRTLGLLGGEAAYAGARAGLVTRAGRGIDTVLSLTCSDAGWCST